MRQIWLIAWHGFVQHATSRSFLFGVILLPVYMLVAGMLPSVSDTQLALLGGPVRHFAVIDRTGELMPAIDRELERDLTVRGLFLLNKYAEDHADADRLRRDAPALAALVLDGDPDSESSVVALENMGGAANAFVALQPFLQPGAPPFEKPRRRFIRVDVPVDVASAVDLVNTAAIRLRDDARL